MTRAHHADVVIVGSGMGGGTLAWALRDSGAECCCSSAASSCQANRRTGVRRRVFVENRYKAKEQWRERGGEPFSPGVHYFVGGNTKVYGAALPRLRQQDFGESQHAGGTSPALADFVRGAGSVLRTGRAAVLGARRGRSRPDRSARSRPYPLPADAGRSVHGGSRRAHAAQGLHPAPLPVGLDLRPGGKCIRCGTCDAFPCGCGKRGCRCLCGAPGARVRQCRIWTGTMPSSHHRRARQESDRGREVARRRVRDDPRHGRRRRAGRSTRRRCCCGRRPIAHPHGLANSSGLVGRNYMVHTNSVLVAIDPRRPNPTVFQKTIAINDFYLAGADPFRSRWATCSRSASCRTPMLGALPRVPDWCSARSRRHSVDWWVMSEDLPDSGEPGDSRASGVNSGPLASEQPGRSSNGSWRMRKDASVRPAIRFCSIGGWGSPRTRISAGRCGSDAIRPRRCSIRIAVRTIWTTSTWSMPRSFRRRQRSTRH